jgi:RNA polymerase sigma-70 factor (ECF subfamily)
LPAPETSNSTSESLLQRVRRFEPEAWERLVQLYGPVIYGWGRQAGLQSDDASDVMQEVFRAVAANIAKFRSYRQSDSFRGWLWTIAHNKIRDHYRGLAARPAAAGGTAHRERMHEVVASPPDESSDSGRRELTGLHKRALDLIEAEFPPHQWRAFLDVTATGRPPADVAAELGISVWSVYQAKSRILRRLREELDDLMDV